MAHRNEFIEYLLEQMQAVGEATGGVSARAMFGGYGLYFHDTLSQEHFMFALVADEPVEVPWIEYNNVYPFGTGRCMLFAPDKRFDRTLMVDKHRVVWHFPHQHCMHYSAKIRQLHFADGTLAGFFEEDFNPVVMVEESSLPPDWAICGCRYSSFVRSVSVTGRLGPGSRLTNSPVT